MTKELMLKRIQAEVAKNAKQGKLVTTKYVGPFEYKSGYDTYIAVGFDDKDKIVVFSYYQNDRGEHIDTYKVDILNLTDKVLSEVYENLSTTDEDVRDYIEWTHLDDKYKDKLASLGLFKLKNPSERPIDVDNLPTLKDDTEAYVIDRQYNVGVMKYVGIDFKRGKPLWQGPNGCVACIDEKNKYEVVEYIGHEVKNSNFFKILCGYKEYSEGSHFFVRNKEALLDAIEKSKTLKRYYIVSLAKDRFLYGNILKVAKSDLDKDTVAFEEEQDAVDFYNSVVLEAKKMLDELILKYEAKIAELSKQKKPTIYELRKKYAKKAFDVEFGDWYLADNEYVQHELKFVIEKVNIIEKLDNFEVIGWGHHGVKLSDGRIMSGNESVFTKEEADEILAASKDSKNQLLCYKLCGFEESLKYFKERLSKRLKPIECIDDAIDGIDFDSYEKKLEDKK